MFRSKLQHLPLLLAALPLLSGEPAGKIQFSGGVDLIRSLPGLEKATHQTGGYGANAAATIALPNTDLFARASFAYNDFQGAQHGTARTDLSSTQLGLDVLVPINNAKNLFFVLGMTGNHYIAKNTGDETFQYQKVFYPVATGGFQSTEWTFIPIDCWEVTGSDTKGLKLGARMGFEYAMNRHVSFSALIQLTELCGGVAIGSAPSGGGLGLANPKNGSGQLTPTTPPPPSGYSGTVWQRVNRGPVNPSWLSLGVRYTF